MYFNHNNKLYKKFKQILLKFRECCVVAAMGTGKTDVCIEFIKLKSLNTLVVVPNTDLKEQWEYIASLNEITTLSTITYHSFSNNYKLLDGFDCYIFDEAHHMDSKVWGQSIRDFKENIMSNNAYIIGLTGDPIRYFDNCKNVADSMFHSHVVYGHSQYEAIMNGILPQVVYVCAVYNTDGLYEEYYSKATTEVLKGKLNIVYENCLKMNDILIRHSQDNMKGFVFVDKINSIQSGVDLISETFPDETVRFVHSKLSKPEKFSAIKSFKIDTSGFMVAVDMFNEGHHIPGVNTIIMLRKTGSPTIYAQQIGRGMSANHNGTKTVVYDFVGNKESMKSVDKRIKIITKIIEEQLDKKNKKSKSKHNKLSNQVIVHDYAKDFLEVLEEIDEAYYSYPWTEEEDQILKDNYNKKNGLDLCIEKLHRTRIACIKRAKRLGLNKSKKPWTKEEDQILKEYYPLIGGEVYKKLLGRSARACTARANNHLGLAFKKDKVNNKSYTRKKIPKNKNNTDKKSNRWTNYEKDTLIKNYPIIGERAFDMLPNRSIDSCKNMVKHLKLVSGRHKWTPEEDNILKEYYPSIGKNIMKLLPNRSYGAIRFRANKLGIKKNNKSKNSDNIIKE